MSSWHPFQRLLHVYFSPSFLLLISLSQPEEKDLTPESAPVEVQPTEPCPAASPSPEETDETWEEKEDKLDTENIEPETEKSVEQKYQYKEGEGGTSHSPLLSVGF